jgi:hypothetical protein
LSPSIEIDTDVFEVLKRNAEPLVDTPNTVLRRLLGIEDVSTSGNSSSEQKQDSSHARSPDSRSKPSRRSNGKRSSTRAPSGSLMPEHEYEMPILNVLNRHGGRAASREVVAEVGEIVKSNLRAKDFEKVSSGGVRWENRIHFCRLRLIERGLLKKGSPRGVWEISEEGSNRIDQT